MKPYLQPSGYTGKEPRGGETGSNGLIIDAQGRLVLCQHGDRRMARMDAPLDSPKPQFTTLADRYEGKRLNSPNDAVFRSNGDLYFTDPAVRHGEAVGGPEARDPVCGRLPPRRPEATVTLMTKDMTRPNGLAFSPDEKQLYVAQSDADGGASGGCSTSRGTARSPTGACSST